MKVLGIDTSTKFLSLGIYADNKICEYNLDLGRNLSALITVTIKRVIDALGWRVSDIDYFACGLGPGSFTGLRVGIATIKGLAFSLNKPVVGVSTLDILARNVSATDADIIPIVDAKRSLVYSSVYRNKNGNLFRIKPYMLLSMDEFFAKIKIKGKAVVFGDAVSLYKQKIITNMNNVTILDKDYWYPNGRNIIDLAVRKIKNKEFYSAASVRPIYLYPKECQIKSRK